MEMDEHEVIISNLSEPQGRAIEVVPLDRGLDVAEYGKQRNPN
jgi:hypothetical protein